MWKKNVVKFKHNNVAQILEKKLFYLNPIMRKTLLEFRKNSYEMMNTLRFIGIDDKEGFSTTGADSTFTLNQFKEYQERTRKKINKEIQVYSAKCREIVKGGFDESLAELKKNQYLSNDDENLNQNQNKKPNQNFFRLKESAYEALGFSDNMTYEKRSELRKECSKFLRFAYLVDFLAMESLSQIFIYSVKELQDKLENLMKPGIPPFVIKDIS